MTVTFSQDSSSFFVDENLYYAPSGRGIFVFSRFEKWDMTTAHLKKAVSERTGVPMRAINHGGFKDRAARARQWLSWPRDMQRQGISDGPNFSVLETTFHDHGLKVGHVKSNRFELTFLGSPTETVAQCHENDVVFPNFFGRQRFGQRAIGIENPAEVLRGQIRTRMDVSRFQAALFNSFFQKRRRDVGDRILPEDLCLEPFRKMCISASDIPPEHQELNQVSPAGPIFGYRMIYPQHTIEQEFLTSCGLDLESFRFLGKRARGGRRALYVAARDMVLSHPEKDRFVLAFTLPSGSYATVFLTHLFFPERLEKPVDTWPDFTQTLTLSN